MITDADVEDARVRLAAVRERMAAAARRAGRDPESVTLVAVSKRQPPERVAAAVCAGVAHLGENYVQDARRQRERVEALLAERGVATPCWHMVGGLQRNKARDAVATFDVVESLDRAALADALARRAEAADRELDVWLQVSLCGEPQKGGVPPEEVAPLLAACAGHPRLHVRGLMTVPAADPDPEAARPVFAQLRALRDTLREAPGGAHLHGLSMGMSADFEVAIEEGSTHVRVGTAVFGPRES